MVTLPGWVVRTFDNAKCYKGDRLQWKVRKFICNWLPLRLPKSEVVRPVEDRRKDDSAGGTVITWLGHRWRNLMIVTFEFRGRVCTLFLAMPGQKQFLRTWQRRSPLRDLVKLCVTWRYHLYSQLDRSFYSHVQLSDRPVLDCFSRSA